MDFMDFMDFMDLMDLMDFMVYTSILYILSINFTHVIHHFYTLYPGFPWTFCARPRFWPARSGACRALPATWPRSSWMPASTSRDPEWPKLSASGVFQIWALKFTAFPLKVRCPFRGRPSLGVPRSVAGVLFGLRWKNRWRFLGYLVVSSSTRAIYVP